MSEQGPSAAPEELSHLAPLGQAFLDALGGPLRDPQPQPPRPARASRRHSVTYVVDRRGNRVPVRFDLITERNEDLRSNPAYGPELETIDSPLITKEVVGRFRNGMSTRELDAETAAICVDLASRHPDYEWLAARIAVSDLHKRTPPELSRMLDAVAAAAEAEAAAAPEAKAAQTPGPSGADAARGELPAAPAAAGAPLQAAKPPSPFLRLSAELLGVVRRASAEIDGRLDAARDYRLRFFGFNTLARGYLLRPGPRSEMSPLVDTQLMERPQHLYMRIALGVFVCQADGRGHEAPAAEFAERLRLAFRFYDALSLQLVSNATPTMLNAGTVVPQLSSCFQLSAGDDLGSLGDMVKSLMMVSKWSGGASFWLHGVRAEGAPIRRTGGRSSGVKKYVRILNDVQLYVDQGGNRLGAFAAYLADHHADVLTFLRMGRPKADEESRPHHSPDLKYGLWVSDLLMQALCAQLENEARVAAGGADDPAAGDWYLFSPDEAPGLHLVWGEEFRALRDRYVAEGRFRRRIKVEVLFREAFKTWAQAGVPYVLFKDAANRKSNMQNVGPICSSNLCTEILIPSWSEFDAATFARFHPENAAGGEFGVCNLGAVCLESFVVPAAEAPSPPSLAPGPAAEALSAPPKPLTLVTPSASLAPAPAPAPPQADAAESKDARMILAKQLLEERLSRLSASRVLVGAAAPSEPASPSRRRYAFSDERRPGQDEAIEVQVLDLARAVDFRGIIRAAALETLALNRVIDQNYYPSEECRRSNRRHRPIGVGLMGLDDVFKRLRLAYDSRRARRLARAIAAALYYGALSESARLAEVEGPYASFAGSPLSRGKLQPDLWVDAGDLAWDWELEIAITTGGVLQPADWQALRARARRGVRNAYVTAYMPTASTSNIVGQNECFEPYTSNLYTRKTLSGEYLVANRHLMAELAAEGLWDDQMRRDLLASGGSVQGLARVPAGIRRRYRTAREIHPTHCVEMAKAMGPFVCQSMSFNLFWNEPSLPKILRALVEAWKGGLKGVYYNHTLPATGSQKTSVKQAAGERKGDGPGLAATAQAAPSIAASASAEATREACSRLNKEACVACAL